MIPISGMKWIHRLFFRLYPKNCTTNNIGDQLEKNPQYLCQAS